MRRLRAKASYVLEAFAGVKINKKEGLPGRHKDSQVRTRDKWLNVSHDAGSALIHDVIVHLYRFDCYATSHCKYGSLASILRPKQALKYSKNALLVASSTAAWCPVTAHTKHAGSCQNDARLRTRKTSATSGAQVNANRQ